ncbi:MAG: serine/threonine protein kinase [Myxococcales bacterium]|nr:serine/threonine protein kinase [Myxococcales bacterium]
MPRTSDNLPRAHGSDPDAWRSHDSRLTADEVTRDSAASHTDGGDADGPEHRERASGYLDHTARIGRFAVLRQLGEGGMGVVYSAYDEQLDRRVALKLLRPGRDNSERNQSRMQREARAMAKLSHPNVVQVYEVGRFEDQVYLAMEFVHGRTLGAWLKAAPRTWQQILDVMVQAGQGLHAAHEAGVIHGDFKPDNILIDAADKARVVDFGLSRRAEPAGASLRAQQLGETTRVTGSHPVVPRLTGSLVTPSTSATPPTPASLLLPDDATRHGPEAPRSSARIAGTPAYMAPEQHRHQPADQRSDQFSFCITLHAALYGRHPFAGGSLLELVINLTDGRMNHPPPSGHPVPPGVYAAITRGLSLDPDQRFASVQDLLAELERGSGRARDPEFDLSVARRQRVLLGGVIGVTVLGVTTAIIGLNETRLPSPGLNVLAGAVVNALIFGLIYGYRTSLLKNTINRRVMAWIAVSSLALLAHRAIAAYNGVSVAATMVNDLIILGSIAVMAAVSIERWIAGAGVILFVAAALTILFPAASSALLGGAIVGVFCLAVLFWSR